MSCVEPVTMRIDLAVGPGISSRQAGSKGKKISLAIRFTMLVLSYFPPPCYISLVIVSLNCYIIVFIEWAG